MNGFVYNAPRAFGGGNRGAGDTKIISILLLWCFGVTMGVLVDTGMNGDKCKVKESFKSPNWRQERGKSVFW